MYYVPSKFEFYRNSTYTKLEKLVKKLNIRNENVIKNLREAKKQIANPKKILTRPSREGKHRFDDKIVGFNHVKNLHAYEF